jgi:hypothetical protein
MNPRSNVIPLHRMTQATRDAEMLEAIEQRLREGSPKSGAKHIDLARPTAMRFRLKRALMTLGSDGGLVSREPLVTASRQGSRGTKAGPHGCSRSSAPPVPKSGARHVRLTDSVQVGENEFEEPHNIRADLVALAAGVVSALILVVVVAS